MCYLIAKDVNKQGCLALQISHGKHLSALTKQLMRVPVDKNSECETQ
jgi:hypothetical protein